MLVYMNVNVLLYHWLAQQMKIGTGENPFLNEQELCHKWNEMKTNGARTRTRTCRLIFKIDATVLN